ILLSSLLLLPKTRVVRANSVNPKWDLPLRMLCAVALVWVLTSLADQLGPKLSGVLTPFPVATAVSAAFTHAQNRLQACTAFFRGVLPGLLGFAIFCVVLAVALRSWQAPLAIGCALVAQLATQAFVLNMRRDA